MFALDCSSKEAMLYGSREMMVVRADMFVPTEARSYPCGWRKGGCCFVYLHKKGYSSIYIGDSNGSSYA